MKLRMTATSVAIAGTMMLLTACVPQAAGVPTVPTISTTTSTSTTSTTTTTSSPTNPIAAQSYEYVECGVGGSEEPYASANGHFRVKRNATSVEIVLFTKPFQVTRTDVNLVPRPDVEDNVFTTLRDAQANQVLTFTREEFIGGVTLDFLTSQVPTGKVSYSISVMGSVGGFGRGTRVIRLTEAEETFKVQAYASTDSLQGSISTYTPYGTDEWNNQKFYASNEVGSKVYSVDHLVTQIPNQETPIGYDFTVRGNIVSTEIAGEATRSLKIYDSLNASCWAQVHVID
jgi:hypothetical protein